LFSNKYSRTENILNSYTKICSYNLHIASFALFILTLIFSHQLFAQDNFEYSDWQLYETVLDGNNKVIVKIEYQTKLQKNGSARAKWRIHNLSGLSATRLGINSKLYTLSDGRSKWTSGVSKSRSKSPIAHDSIVTFGSDLVSTENDAKITKVTLEYPAFQGTFINDNAEKIKLSSDEFSVMHRNIISCKSDKKIKRMPISIERLGDAGFKVINEENKRSFTFLAKAYFANPNDKKVKAEYKKKFQKHAEHLCGGKVGFLKKLTDKFYRVMTECSNKNGSISCNKFGEKSTAIGVRG